MRLRKCSSELTTSLTMLFVSKKFCSSVTSCVAPSCQTYGMGANISSSMLQALSDHKRGFWDCVCSGML